MAERQDIDIKENYIKCLDNELLSVLLKDRSSNRNIIWATDNYAEKGAAYGSQANITVDLITGRFGKVIRPRIDKSKKEQYKRIKEKAEVFTPSWICNEMNGYLDEDWFEKKNVFNIPTELTWKSNENKIEFPTGKTWKDYVQLKILELSCGEAPFLCTRYDTTTGEWIDTQKRIGVLDKKLRVINENIEQPQEWYDWVLMAFKSVFGYEWQGDSLLIARENLLFTFIDYYIERFDEFPSKEKLLEIAKILSWNIWQMDGLKYVIPNSCKPIESLQMSFFIEEKKEPCIGCTKNDNSRHTGIYCKIMNWETKRSIKVYKGEKRMKFDYVIGNPPYQETTAIKETENGQKTSKSIFHYFQQSADTLSNEMTCLIYPAIRWIHRSGKGMAEFGLKQINDPRLKKLVLYHNASEVFPTTEIGDGVSIVIKSQKKTTPGFTYVYKKGKERLEAFTENPNEELMVIYPKDIVISQKIGDFIKEHNLSYMFDSVLPRNLFGIESNSVELNPDKFKPFTIESAVAENEVKVFTNDKAGKAGRAMWFVTDRKNIENNPQMIKEWQVVVSSASPGGQKRNNQLEIIDDKSVFGRSRVALKSFKTKTEAENFYKYVSSTVVRYSMLLTDENLTSFGKKVPDLLDYSTSKFINFSEDIDKQLIDLFSINSEEFDYMQSRVNKL